MKMPKDENNPDSPAGSGANPGYVLGQLAAAFAASQDHVDLAARARAAKKARKWIEVLNGMMSGALRIGSRTPVGNIPSWATLEVVKGGFATGALLAGGPLQPHEEEMLATLSHEPSTQSRAIINSCFLGDAGIADLQRMLVTGQYRVNVPEEGALLMVAWLLAHGDVEQARLLLEQIGPFLATLRFYPVPYPRPLTDRSSVFLQTVGQTIQDLKVIKVSTSLLAQREAILVWTPLYDRAVRLFLETLEGPVPFAGTGVDGRPIRTATGTFSIEGGWPCQHFPEGWTVRAQALLDDYRRLRKDNLLCGKPDRPGENFALLRGYLETCVTDPNRLSGRDVGRIRQVLANIATRRGIPDSPRCRQLRQLHAKVAVRATNADLARVMIARMAPLPQDEGLDSLDEALAPVTVEEAREDRLEPGQLLAPRLGHKIRRCLAAPVEVLIDEGIITSGEVLARVIPQMTGQIAAAGITDPDLRRVYGAIYRAFRCRRSLLLLNLQNQVKFAELPWVRAAEVYRRSDAGTQEAARQSLIQVVVLAVTAFPYQILPNKLLQEIRALADTADLQIPLVDEVAADIFMGAFTEKYLRAAQAAARLLEGTLYESYYGFSYSRVRQIDDVKPFRSGGAPVSAAFVDMCKELAGPAGAGSWVARNGAIIEQEQILTSHNLAVLFDALGLIESLPPRLGELARRCFEWICRRQQQPIAHRKAQMQMIKNTAYAWRQMVFFLALQPADEVAAFLTWAADHLDKQPDAFKHRFRPAYEGLARTARGLSPEDPERPAGASESRRLLGWTMELHWLLLGPANADLTAHVSGTDS